MTDECPECRDPHGARLYSGTHHNHTWKPGCVFYALLSSRVGEYMATRRNAAES